MENANTTTRHIYLMCLFSWKWFWKACWHWEHWYFVSISCVETGVATDGTSVPVGGGFTVPLLSWNAFLCLLRLPELENTQLQSSQEYMRALPECCCKCWMYNSRLENEAWLQPRRRHKNFSFIKRTSFSFFSACACLQWRAKLPMSKIKQLGTIFSELCK